ncbi:ImmA/IrrE family metallo-endopeptidase [Mycobacteroides abscessus]
MPVDILKVAAAFADIEHAAWPMTSVDGITVNCADPRPQIFYRGDPDDVRTRFTIAHELGHAVLPWHIGTAECAIPMGEKAFRSLPEKEADEFAAELLLPTDWVRKLVRESAADLNLVLPEVDRARVSATASLIGLANVLHEGWALQLNNQPLVLPRYYGVHRTRVEADQASFSSGSASVNGQTIRWWRMYTLPEMPGLPPDKAAAYALLDSALLKHNDPECGRRSIDGSVSAVLGGLGGMFDTLSAFGFLLYRLGLGPYESLCANSDFRAWLGWKVTQSCSQFRAWG